MDKRYTINVFSEERSNFNKITAFHDHLISQSNSRNKSNTSRFDKLSGHSDNSIPTPSPNDHKRISGFHSVGRSDIEIINEDIELHNENNITRSKIPNLIIFN